MKFKGKVTQLKLKRQFVEKKIKKEEQLSKEIADLTEELDGLKAQWQNEKVNLKQLSQRKLRLTNINLKQNK